MAKFKPIVKFKLKELLARQEFETGESISIIELSNLLSISKNTLYRIANSKGDYNTTTDNVAKLCHYFGCTPNDLMVIVPEPTEGQQAGKTE